MARATKLEREAELVFYKYFDGIQVDIFNLGKVSKAIQALVESGAELAVEVPKLVEQYKEA
ncbi:MAG: hypothetical protein JRJ45_06960 [Deltaproteobacteria bacterium]|nr:hypothetical protein [Deltaproteobacteria bacterium]